MATLGPETRKALQRLREHKSVLEVTYNWYEIRVKFLTGIRENWVLHKRSDRRRQFSIPFNENDKMWVKEIPTFCEFQSKPFDDVHNDIIKPFFKVQYLNVANAGFMDSRIKVHELTQQIYEEGWIEPLYPKEALREDLKRVCDQDPTKAAHSVNHISAYPSGTRQPGVVVLSHFAPDWGGLKDPYRPTLKEAWSKKNTIYRLINVMWRMNRDITRTELIRTAMGFKSRKYGPRFIAPIFYRGLIERVLGLKSPTVLDPTPSHGSVALALAAKGGSMLFEPDGRFSEFSSGLSDFLEVPIKKYSGESVDAVIFGTLYPMGLEDVQATLEKYRNNAGNVVCAVSNADMAKIAAATNPKRVITAQITGLRGSDDNLLIY